MTRLERITHLRHKGFNARDIASVMNMTDAELREAEGRLPREEDNYYKLRAAGRHLLRRVPAWWKGTTASYLHCVRMNFGDVLGLEESKALEQQVNRELDRRTNPQRSLLGDESTN